MKNLKTILIVLFITISFKSFSQDIIIKNDKTELKVKVLELTDDVIKYRKFEMLDGPIYSIKKLDVFMIIYKNGTKEYIENKQKEVENIPINPSNNSISPSNIQNNTKVVYEVKPKEMVQEKKGKFYSALAIDDRFHDLDINFIFRLKDNFFVGLSVSGNYDEAGYNSLYPYLSYKLPVSENFNLWSSLGYKHTIFKSYDTVLSVYPYSSYTVPTTTIGDFSWQIGVDYFFLPDESLGITVYSYELESFFFGLIYKW